jgi:hypothetical protein
VSTTRIVTLHRAIDVGIAPAGAETRPRARRLGPAGLLTVIALLALPAAASAQAAPRTWVSGTGDDAQPCSRSAPCKTWQGALEKTAAGGEVDALDPGGYGTFTITKSITIDGGGGQVASVLAAGLDGITVQAGPTAHVILRNLRINGVGTGLDGVKFVSGSGLRIENLAISGLTRNGVNDETTNDSTLVVSNSMISENARNGVLVAPRSGSSATAVLENDALENNACGLAVTTLGTGAGPCGTGASAVGPRPASPPPTARCPRTRRTASSPGATAPRRSSRAIWSLPTRTASIRSRAARSSPCAGTTSRATPTTAARPRR